MIASLVNHLWQSTLFVLAVVLIVRALRDDAARIRYGLWLAASVKFLVPFSLLTAMGARLAPLPESSIPEIFAWRTSLEWLAEPVEPAAFSGPLALAMLAAWGVGAVTLLAKAMLQARRLNVLVRGASTSSPTARISAALPIKYSSTQIEPALV